jgi:uncharacterized membrane protein (DUF2068 family)
VSESATVSEGAAQNASRLTRQQAFGVVLALLIGYTSILSAVVAWRASLSSIDAGRYESLAVQQQARREQLQRQSEGVVSQDLRVVAVYREHALAARELQAQADEVRVDDPELADELDLEAQGRLALARALQPFLLGQSGVYLFEDGSVAYDPERILRILQENDLELRELRPEQTLSLANAADQHTLALVALAAVLVGALLFLTVAQVSRRAPLRLGATALGAVLAAAATAAFVGIEVLGL